MSDMPPRFGTMRPVLALFAMLPVFVMLGWLISYRGEARARELEDARQILGLAADRVEASIAPTAPLESILSEEMSNIHGDDLSKIEEALRKAFEQVVPAALDSRVVRINLFAEDCQPLCWPSDENPNTGRTIWNVLNQSIGEDILEKKAVIDPDILASVTAALSDWFSGHVTIDDLKGASTFALTVHDRLNRPTAMAVYRLSLDKMRIRYRFGALIRIPLEAIPPSSYHRWAVVSRPSDEDASGLGILDPAGTTWLVRAGTMPEVPLHDLLEHPGRVVAVPGGFAMLRDLPPHALGKLVLFRSAPFLMAGGGWLALAVAVLVALSASFSWLLAGFLTSSGLAGDGEMSVSAQPIRMSRSLRTRTAVVFLLAGMVPVGFSLMQGSMRLRDLETVRRIEWQIEAQRVMTALDRGFRDALERYQEIYASLIRDIAGKPEKRISEVSPRLTRCSEILDIEVNDRAAKGSGEITIRTTEGRRLIMQPVVHKLMYGVFREMRAAAGDPPLSEETAGKERLALPVHELLGDAVPLKELFNQLGHITYMTLANKTVLLLCLPYSLRNERIAGMLVAGSTRGVDSREYLDGNTDAEHWRHRGWELLRIDKTIVDPKLSFVPREFLRLAVRTEQTGAAVAARVDFPDGPYIVQTSLPRYLNLGTLAARVPVGHLKKGTTWTFALACAGVLTALALAVGVGVFLSRRLLDPIRRLQQAAETVGEGVLDVSLPVRGQDELAMLGRAFLEMTDGLKQRERMRRFLSASAWAVTETERVGNTTKSGYINAAILCSDIRGFTSISEKQPPASVTAMLNEYFTAMDGVIRGFGGEIDKLVGDAIQAVFIVGDGIEHPAIRAARAGLAMRRTLAGLNRARILRGEFPVENGVGIHFGRMISGRVGAAGGRQDFTVVGSPVAFAARLEAASRAGRQTKVVVSAETAALIAREFPCEPLEGLEDGRAYEIIRDPVGYTEPNV